MPGKKQPLAHNILSGLKSQGTATTALFRIRPTALHPNCRKLPSSYPGSTDHPRSFAQ